MKTLPSSKPLATPENDHTAVQKNSHQLKISGGQALIASLVVLIRLGLPADMVLALGLRTHKLKKIGRPFDTIDLERLVPFICLSGATPAPTSMTSDLNWPCPN